MFFKKSNILQSLETGNTEDIIKEETISELATKITAFCYALLSKNQTYLAYKAVKQIEWLFIANTKFSDMIKYGFTSQ